jgi:glutamine phosphoribosylpyrophosphate amidotransferase
MVLLEGGNIRAVASEESALRILGKEGTVRNVKPGEAVVWSAR